MQNTSSVFGQLTTPSLAVYVVGLGANLGDCVATFKEAIRRLNAVEGCDVTALSRVYVSKALGPTQPDYRNAAVRVESVLGPRELLNALLAIEGSLGRVRVERWGPRIIDLDILWSDRYRVAEDGLNIPHAELELRDFALAPLLDVLADVERAHYESALARVSTQIIAVDSACI